MFKKTLILGVTGVMALFAVMIVMAATVTDRGLPDENLNNAAGANRSNVAWSWGTGYVTGDDFTVGAAGETWIVTSVTTWQVGMAYNSDAEFGDRYSDATLYLGSADSGGISAVSTGALTVGSSVNNNSSITHTKVSYDDVNQPSYDAFGNPLQVWETTFSGLSYIVDGGTKYVFGVDGNVVASDFNWFNHASNSEFSGTLQEGADDFYLAWDKNDLSAAPYPCDSGNAVDCGGWDKSSDINVVVTAVLAATEVNACKSGGWESVVRLDGTSFKNQGDCVSYMQNGK